MENGKSPDKNVEKRGGARRGAGRKRSTAKVYQLYATKEVMDILEAVPGSKSEYICKAVLHYTKSL